MQLSEFTFYISKASFDKTTQERRWTAVASDTGLDLSNERMSIDVFKSFTQRAKDGVKVPTQFASKFWDGGMPYISVSHYLDLDGKWAAGVVDDLFIDGEKLKAKGTFFNNPIGIKVFDSVCKSLYSETGDGYEQKIRISIGFIDFAHKHGDILFERKNLSDVCPYCAKGVKEKVYIDGQLVHLAVTRIPCNQRTDFGLDLEEKSMTTRKQDAATIVGDELAEKMEDEHVLVGKVEESLVIKKDKDKTEEEPVEEEPTEVSDEESDEEDDKKEKVTKSEATVAKFGGGAMSFSEYETGQEAQESMGKLYDVLNTFGGIAENILSYSPNQKEDMKSLVGELSTKLEEKTFRFQEKLDERLELVINKLDNRVELVQKSEPHPLDEALMNLKSQYDSAIEGYETVEDRLQAIQSGIDAVGEAILENVKPKSEAEEEVQKSSSEESIERMLEKAIAPLAEKLAKITEQWNSVVETQNTVTKGVYIPQPRGMNASELATKSVQTDNSPTPKLAAMVRGINKTQAPRTRL